MTLKDAWLYNVRKLHQPRMSAALLLSLRFGYSLVVQHFIFISFHTIFVFSYNY